jgi:toxin-antitoxin system PIN domain toxin
MLYLPDVNILIYANMNGVAEHAAAFAWLYGTLDDPNSTILFCETTLLSFLRLTTNKKIFYPPLPLSDALSITSGFMSRANVLVYHPSPGHFIEVAKFVKKHNFAGNLVIDAHLAVAAMSTGAVLVTRDSDFDKIPYLKTINPIGPQSDE